VIHGDKVKHKQIAIANLQKESFTILTYIAWRKRFESHGR